MAPPAKGPDLKIRLKSKLLSLEDRDLVAQAERDLQKLCKLAANQTEVGAGFCRKIPGMPLEAAAELCMALAGQASC